jgi:hypothetical protein
MLKHQKLQGIHNRMATAQPSQVEFKLEGGAKLHQAIAEWSKQSSSLFTTLFLVVLLVFAAYADQLPKEALWQLSTPIGRLLMIALLFVVYEMGGWISALLFGIGILMVWSNRPLAHISHMTKSLKEGFQGRHDKQAGQKHIKIQGSRWFVEEVLHEHPEGIEEDRVYTQAVQEDTYSPNSRTSR